MRFPIPISLLLVLACCGCSKDGGTPRTVSAAYLTGMYAGYPIAITDELYFEGTVVSSGEHGNFYKELVIADATGGITLKADDRDVWQKYPQWSSVTVQLSGLVLGSYGGKAELGTTSSDPAYQTQYISGDMVARHVKLRGGGAKPDVRPIVIEKLGPSDIGTYRMIGGLSYDPDSPANSDASRTWNGNRCFKDSAGDSIVVRTSSYADFAGREISDAPLSLEGVVGYFNRTYQLVLVSAD